MRGQGRSGRLARQVCRCKQQPKRREGRAEKRTAGQALRQSQAAIRGPRGPSLSASSGRPQRVRPREEAILIRLTATQAGPPFAAG